MRFVAALIREYVLSEAMHHKRTPLEVERAIDSAIEGDLSVFDELRQVLQQSYIEQPSYAAYADPPRPDERVY